MTYDQNHRVAGELVLTTFTVRKQAAAGALYCERVRCETDLQDECDTKIRP